MSTAPTTGNPPVRQRNWVGYLWVVFGAAYVFVPWHYGVFFGQRLQCIYFPRDWILHAFALFGYITLASIIVIYRIKPESDRASATTFAAGMTAFVILGLMLLQYGQDCL